jgi:sigma-E factor negative regulatory protein RseA
MTDKQMENLSALIDGELDELSVQRLLGQLKDNPELTSKWARYHLMGDAMRGDMQGFANVDLSSSISAALATEAPLTAAAPLKHSTRQWWKPAAGLSVAASVAMAVIFGAYQLRSADTGFEQVADAAPAESAEVAKPPVYYKGPTMVASTESEADLKVGQDKLNEYLRQHAQDAAMGQGRSMMPFARVVNFETQQQGR